MNKINSIIFCWCQVTKKLLLLSAVLGCTLLLSDEVKTAPAVNKEEAKKPVLTPIKTKVIDTVMSNPKRKPNVHTPIIKGFYVEYKKLK